LALLSFLPLKQSRRIPVALVYTWRIAQQLKSARGLIGYTLWAQLLAKSFWTLSAWESEVAMRAFVQAPPHGEIMAGLAPYMGQTSFNQ
jgi:heme-degrading monooxygenase HmoA